VAPTGKRDAPRKRGDKLQPNDPASQFDPSGEGEAKDPAGKLVQVRAWKQMHIRDADWLTLCVIRVERPQAADIKRDPRISWFVWIGDEHADLIQVALCCLYHDCHNISKFTNYEARSFDKEFILHETSQKNLAFLTRHVTIVSS
jgi:hypothetical protein